MTQFVKVELILTNSEAEKLLAEQRKCEELHGPTSLDVVASLLVGEALVERQIDRDRNCGSAAAASN